MLYSTTKNPRLLVRRGGKTVALLRSENSKLVSSVLNITLLMSIISAVLLIALLSTSIYCWQFGTLEGYVDMYRSLYATTGLFLILTPFIYGVRSWFYRGNVLGEVDDEKWSKDKELPASAIEEVEAKEDRVSRANMLDKVVRMVADGSYVAKPTASESKDTKSDETPKSSGFPKGTSRTKSPASPSRKKDESPSSPSSSPKDTTKRAHRSPISPASPSQGTDGLSPSHSAKPASPGSEVEKDSKWTPLKDAEVPSANTSDSSVPSPEESTVVAESPSSPNRVRGRRARRD